FQGEDGIRDRNVTGVQTCALPILLRAKANVNAMFMVEDYAEEYMNHFFNVIRLYKKGKVKNLASYLYVTWERLSSEISRRRNGDWKWLKIFGEESRGAF